MEKYRPIAPAGVVASIVRGLGDLGDAEDDSSLPVSRQDVEVSWVRRQPDVVQSVLL